MKQLAAIAIALTGASLTWGQEAGTQPIDTEPQATMTAAQPGQNDAVSTTQVDGQRPIRQRLRDPARCQAAQDQPARQRLCDPGRCPRRGPAEWGGQRGMGWGRMDGRRGAGGGRGWCPNHCGRGFHGGWRHGRGGWDQQPAAAPRPPYQEER